MMLRIRKYFFVAALLIGLCGCTHNNGDIGELFGTWRLDNISISEVDDEGIGQVKENVEVKDVFWSFQSQVIRMQRVLPYHDAANRWGSWSMNSDTSLLLNFTHANNDGDPGKGAYEILSGIFLPAREVVPLEVRQLQQKRMILRYADTEAQRVYTYFFTKW